MNINYIRKIILTVSIILLFFSITSTSFAADSGSNYQGANLFSIYNKVVNTIKKNIFSIILTRTQAQTTGIIFQDNFDSSPYWDSQMGLVPGLSNADPPPNWDTSNEWSAYGLPSTQIINNSCGRVNSGCMQINYENGYDSTGGIIKYLPGSSELYFRWYEKFDSRWQWVNLIYFKMGRMRWAHDTGNQAEFIPDWSWMPPVLATWSDKDGRSFQGSSAQMPNDKTYFSNYGTGKWYSIEFRLTTNTPGQNNGKLRVWLNGVLRQSYDDIKFTNVSSLINWFNLGDNTNNFNTGGAVIPTPPGEWWVRFDDVKVGTNYIGPEECPNGTQITSENTGPCYCGTSSPSPDSTVGIYASGYCNNNIWSSSPPSTPDITSPSTPTSLVATVISTSQINLSWTASGDNVGVIGYKIYRNGSQVGTSAIINYLDTGLSVATAYQYAVSAYDAAGNNSSQSSQIFATTQSVPSPTGRCFVE